MQTPDVFQHSYEVFETYPRNICNNSAYPGILQAYANRLDGAASRLLTESEAEVSVPFRDLFSASQGITEFRKTSPRSTESQQTQTPTTSTAMMR